MRSTLAIVALLGMASAQARKDAMHDEHHMFLDGPEAALQNFSEAMNVSRDVNIIPGVYLVEFADGYVGSPHHSLLVATLTLIKDNTSFYTSLHAGGVMTTSRMVLNYTLFQGASFRINDISLERTHASKIATMSTVKQMWPLRNYTIPEIQRKNLVFNPNGTIDSIGDNAIPDADTVSRRDTFSTHAMTQVDKLRAEGITGHGLRIGIVDTGVDYMHPALGGCFGKTCLVSYGYDLVGQSWDGFGSPEPSADPYDDCIGHGTHVSGIIAAQPNKMNFTGAAPNTTLGMYKVFSCDSWGTTDDVLIAAFNAAYEDGSDIITSSIGGQIGWSEAAWSVAVSRIVDAGVPCTVAAGNEGSIGLFGASNAADGQGVTAVASFDNVVTPLLLPKAFYKESLPESDTERIRAGTPSAFGWMPSYPYFRNISLQLKALGNDSGVVADACTTLPEGTGNLSGHAVLIRLGGCAAKVKAENAMAFNADYIVFYADDTSGLPQLDLGDPYVEKPSLNGSGLVTAAVGASWLAALNRGSNIELTFVDPEEADNAFLQIQNNVTGGFASYYTSWGPTWDLDVYPSIAAPGGNILSTYPRKMGGYAILSGTSMATPLAAAIYALVSQARNLSGNSQELKNLIFSTAKANFWNDGGGSLRDLAPVAQQGPGIIQAYDAAYATTLLSRSSIPFNDSSHSPGAVEFVISNEGADTITYELGHNPALGMYMLQYEPETGGASPVGFPNPIFAAHADMNFSETTINLRPKQRAIVSVTPLPPTADGIGGITEDLLPVYSGYLLINGSDGSNLTIPYLGVAGSMYDAQNINSKSSMLSCGGELGFAGSCEYSNVSFTLPYPSGPLEDWEYYYGEDYPTADLVLSLGSALVRADVIALATNYTGPTATVLGNQTAGSVYGFPQTYLDRGEVGVGFNGMVADGSVVPEGYYELLVRVLKIFGNPDQPNDYNHLAVIPFNLKYRGNSSFPGPPHKKGSVLFDYMERE
ncbi:hypothetical protein N0V93_002309 [Gnomoniopsis smithogilvyi]|uniref:Peptidase S8/S53 domain-containing protein n=1 Tax=Gnomoniopsis smithogilvyi TaxID=1191159 RepID=A0A9W9CYW1_9PEZI|nr:hypothetical protein N0V93_002309 [Gnomoniopsis smithogilvyi]